jgi:diaminohydroxyphosphoribosylaminopyrimidine deaminase/5-amino-6-(5-phosphoribosylamino)uracil reductase
LQQLLAELGRRRLTNVLVEAGGRLLGSMFDLGQIDEAHVFIAPKLIGGSSATTPLAGVGLERLSDAATLLDPAVRHLGEDLYISGRLKTRGS